MALTDAWLKANANRPREGELVKSDRDGLSVRVSPKGRLTFQMRYRYDGKPSRIKLGTYPRFTLKQARNECLRIRGLLDEGHNPKLVKAAEKDKVVTRESFETSFTNWFKKNRWGEVIRPSEQLASFEIHVFPYIGKVPPGDIPILSWVSEIERIAAKVPSIAQRIITNIKKYYMWAHRMNVVQNNPVATLSAKVDFKIEKRVIRRTLNDDELRWLWQAFRGTRVTTKKIIMYKLVLLTGCRMIELRLSEKEHFNLDEKVWVVPEKISKTSRLIVRPIIDEIVPLLKLAFALSGKERWVFVSDSTGEPFSGPTVRDAVDSFDNYITKKMGEVMSPWTPHDLRRTARTKLSEHTLPDICEIILAHKLGGMKDVYDQYTYVKEQREALTRLFYQIEGIVGSGKVI